MIYLDNGATTFPKPQSVTNAVQRAMTLYGANPGRSGHELSMKAASQIYECRKTIAEFFNTKSTENVIFTLNCTMSCNIVLKGLLKSGDHVVVSDLEHNAIMRPLHELSKHGVSYTKVKVDPNGNDDLTIDSFRKAINANTKLIVCTHASNVWGIRLPVERLAALAHIYNLPIMVDCAQSAGIFPIDLKYSKIDYLCAAGHKGLYGPMGTGFLIMSDIDKVNSFIQGGTGSLSLSLDQPDASPDKYESGTPNLAGIAGLKAGVDFVKMKGREEILRKETALVGRLYDNMKNIKGVQLYTEKPDAKRYAPILSFNINGVDSEQTAQFLNKNGIAVRGGLHCAPSAHEFMNTLETGAVRICPSVFNKREEIDRVSIIIKKFANETKNIK